jgi:hypothetical protein
MQPFVVPAEKDNANQRFMIPFHPLFSPFQERTPERSCCQSRNSVGWSYRDINKTDSFSCRNQKRTSLPEKQKSRKCHDDEIGNSFAHMPFKSIYHTPSRYANATQSKPHEVFSITARLFPSLFPLLNLSCSK